MIAAWLVMASMLVLSVVYLFASVAKSLEEKEHQESKSFVSIRRQEIAMEMENGRISDAEAKQLLKDLSIEAESMEGFKECKSAKKTRFTRYTLMVTACVFILGSVSLYQWLGYSKEVVFTEHLKDKTTTPEMISRFLQYRTHRYGRPEDWYYEADNFMKQGQYQQAEAAFKTTLKKLPEGSADKVEVLVEYAQAIFYASNKKSTEKMDRVVSQALAIDPNEATALGLKGVSEFANKNYQKAVLSWQKAARNNHNIMERNTLLSAIGKARQMGKISYQDIPPVITDAITVRIKSDSKIQWNNKDVLLVYARIPGQKMPIAIRRVFPAELNRPIVLTNLDNVMSTTTLHDAKKVDVVVKLSNISAPDLTKGRIIGIRRALPSNSESIYSIKVSL